MKKIVKPVIVVEGTSDVNKLCLLVDADFVITNGSEVSRETIEYIRKLSLSRQIIIFTDPDFPGLQIRNKINQEVEGCYNAFVRKEKATKKHKVGIAECDEKEIKEALENILLYKEIDINDYQITNQDIISLNLNGSRDSSLRRDFVSKHFYFGKTNAKTFLKRINMLNITLEELKEVLDKYDHRK